MALTALAPRVVAAEPATTAPVTLHNRAGVAATVVAPVEGWRDRAGTGGGLGAWLEVPLSPDLVVTARAGVVLHAPATVTLGARLRLLEVPVLGGARLEVARAGRVRGLLGGDVGLVVAHERVTLAGVTESDTGLRFAAALVVGVALDPVAVEVGPWLADLTDLDHGIGFQLTIATRVSTW